MTALESWFFASSDVVFLGGEGQAESEGGRPACSSPLLTPQSINLSKEWTGQGDLFLRQILMSPQAQGEPGLSSAVLPARVTTLSHRPPLRLSHGCRHQSSGWGGSGGHTLPACFPASASAGLPSRHLCTQALVIVLTIFSRLCGGRRPLGRVAAWYCLAALHFPKLLAQVPQL